MPREKGNERLMRAVFVDNNKSFPIKDSKVGSDKNRSKLGKRVAKNNPSDTTSLSNNAIQNSQQLSKVNKHNLRNYDKKIEDIGVVYGTNDLYQDVKNVYL